MSNKLKRRIRKTEELSIMNTDGTFSSPVVVASTPSSPSLLPRRKHFQLGRFSTHVLVGVFAAILGWSLHTFFSPHFCVSSFASRKVSDPPWWLEETTDDFFSRTYMTGLSGARKLNVSFYFTGLCGRYRFDDQAFPTISVIITTQNEQSGMLTLTVHTLLTRTPPSILHEIIIVDDNGPEEYRSLVNQTEMKELQQLSKKIRFVNTQREGVARARMQGTRKATGDVLMFVDSHVEMLSGTWAQHLLLPILENPLTLAAQTLDIISDLDWSYGPGSGDLLYGVINTDFWFSYQRHRFDDLSNEHRERESPGRRLPYETPFVAGSLFAVRRDTFEMFGGYDEGMYVWGGENTDFALKMWTCGGRVVMVPCSRVGHMYRIHIKDTGRWPPAISQELLQKSGFDPDKEYKIRGIPSSEFSKAITRNNIRVMERWAQSSSARTGYYKHVFGEGGKLPEDWNLLAKNMMMDPHARMQQRNLKKNRCRDFEWFDRHVYFKLTGVHHPWHPNTTGRTWV